MAFAQIEDLKGSTEVLIFSDVYDRHQGMIAPDTVVLLEGVISKRDGSPKIIANSLERVENQREKFQSKLNIRIKLKTDEVTNEMLEQMAGLFADNKGETPIQFVIHSKHAARPFQMSVRKFVVEPNNELLGGLRELIGSSQVGLIRNGVHNA